MMRDSFEVVDFSEFFVKISLDNDVDDADVKDDEMS
jgi:hypothetical protein